MKRSGFKNPGKPLAPSKGFKPRTTPMNRGTSVLKTAKPLNRGQAQLARATKPMKTRRKTTPIRQSARMEACTIELPHVCNRTPETVVWCHQNAYSAGKGMGLKAQDEYGAYGCSACHAVYDGQVPRPAWLTKEDVEFRFLRAMEISRCILVVKGLL